MASGIYPPWPGADPGPCLQPCEHIDCNGMRADAAQTCRLCTLPIGFGGRVYFEQKHDGRPSIVHASCLEADVAGDDTPGEWAFYALDGHVFINEYHTALRRRMQIIAAQIEGLAGVGFSDGIYMAALSVAYTEHFNKRRASKLALEPGEKGAQTKNLNKTRADLTRQVTTWREKHNLSKSVEELTNIAHEIGAAIWADILAHCDTLKAAGFVPPRHHPPVKATA